MKSFSIRVVPFLLLTMILTTAASTAHAQKKKKKEWTPHYQQPGKFSLELEWFVLTDQEPLSPPISFVPEITVTKNISLGLFVNYYYSRIRQDNNYYSSWYYKTKIQSLSGGIRASYHLAGLCKEVGIKMKPHKLDPFIAALGGMRFATMIDDASTSVSGYYVVGAMFGLRYFYSKKLAFYIQGGYSDLGYANVGITWVLSEVR